MHGKTYLVFELLRKITGSEPHYDAICQLGLTLATNLTVFKATTHHCSCPPVPQATGFRKHEIYAAIHPRWLL